MKQNFFKRWAIPLSLGFILAGCADNLVPEPEKPMEKDTDFYIKVTIASPSESFTRTEGDENPSDPSIKNYEDGSEAERKINKILFVFYNSDHEYVGNSTFIPNDSTKIEGGSDAIETLMTVTVPVTVAAGSTKPAYVMAYVNPTNKAENDLFTNYFSALGAFRTLEDVIPVNSGTTKHDGFAMNNSVYFEGKDSKELPYIAVPIEENQLYTSAEDAYKANAESVVIYVERIVAKVNLTQSNNFEQKDNKVTDDLNNEITLNFVPLSWGLTNLERYTFLVKNFRESAFGNPYSFDDLFSFSNATYGFLNGNNSLGSLKYWNDPGNDESLNSGHRSFWALSPTYYSDQEINNKIPKYADDISDPKETALIYHSFNDIYNTDQKKIGVHGDSIGKVQYTLEHTMRPELVTNFQKRAVTCALVVGKYELLKGNEKITYDNFYLRKLMTENGPVHTIYVCDDSLKNAYLRANSSIYIKVTNDDKDSYESVPLEESYKEDFVIEHPSQDILGDTKIASRYVTLKLILNTQNAGKYYRLNPQTNKFEEITADNILDANKSLYNNLIGMIGGVEMYKDGLTYFEIPIKHLWYRGINDKSIGEDGFSAKLGQYGIVRNHTYSIVLKSIQGIGLGIKDPNDPIVPNVDNDDYSVKTEIRVQRWRVVPPQNVDLIP